MATSADLLIAIKANISQASAQIKALESQAGGIGKSAKASQNLTQAFQKAQPAGLALAGVGALIDVGLIAAIKTAADFEQQVSGIKALLSPADAQAYGAALGSLAVNLGKDTVFTPGEAAAGIAELVRAGVSAQAILDGVGRSALNLAAATGIAVPEAATIAATAMNAFHFQASQAGHVMDVLAGAANSSAADMTDLKFGLAAVGAVAATVGLSFEDTAAGLAVLSNSGLRGQDAGTSLKQTLLSLVPQSKQAREEMERLGLITAQGANQFFDASGKLKGLADVAQVLKVALAGMTKEDQLAALGKIFGSDAIRAASILGVAGAAGINKMTGEISKISVASVAAVQLDNLKGSLEQLKGSIEAVAISLGATFGPAIRTVVDGATSLVNRFAGLSPAVLQFLAIGAAVAGVVFTLAGAFILAVPFILAAGTAFAALGALFAVSVPLGAALAITAVVAALTGITLALSRWSQAREIIAGALRAVAQAAGVLVPVLTFLLSPLILVGLGVIALAGVFAQNWQAIQLTVATAVANILGFLGSLVAGIGGALGPIFAAIGGVLGGPAQDIANAFTTATSAAGVNLAGLTATVQAGLNNAAAVVASSDPFAGLYAKAAPIDYLKEQLAMIGGSGAAVAPALDPTAATANTGSAFLSGATDATSGLNDQLDAAREHLDGVRSSAQSAGSAARSAMQPFADQINAVDKKIAAITLTRLEKVYARLNRRPARTPGQELGRLNLEKQILQAKQTIATPFNAGGGSGGGATGPSAELRAAEDTVKALERQIKAADAVQKLYQTSTVFAQKLLDIQNQIANATLLAGAKPGSAAFLGMVANQFTTGATEASTFPSPSSSTSATHNVTVQGPLVQTGPITGDADEDKVAAKVFTALLSAGKSSTNSASHNLPGAN